MTDRHSSVSLEGLIAAALRISVVKGDKVFKYGVMID
jgi:hypothetical protein